jgi:hypothetical protein
VVCQAWAEWIINSVPFRKNITKTRPAAAGRVFFGSDTLAHVRLSLGIRSRCVRVCFNRSAIAEMTREGSIRT